MNRISVKLGLVFAKAANRELARSFVSFFTREENLRAYVEGGFGRWFPVTTEGQQRPFWQEDLHRKAVYDQITGPTKPYELVYDYRFATLNNENVWAIAINRIVNDKVPVAKAVDELIERIRQTFN